MLNEHLRRAEQQVAEDAARIAQQRTLVAELARAGYSTAQARVAPGPVRGVAGGFTWPRGPIGSAPLHLWNSGRAL